MLTFDEKFSSLKSPNSCGPLWSPDPYPTAPSQQILRSLHPPPAMCKEAVLHTGIQKY